MTAAISSLAAFVAGTPVPDPAIARARDAGLDTLGVMLAGASEPSARAVQRVAADEGGAPRAGIYGTGLRTSAALAALANGTAAHALDYDDMCFVSLAHPSAPLVPAVLAAAESEGLPGRAVLDAYVVGFEIEARLGRLMNPRHYQRGWHCTSTLGTIGAAAAVSRLMQLGVDRTAHALAIAASEASGLKENFGTMVKPLHAGLAARNGVMAAQLAAAGMTASLQAIDGDQGFLTAFASSRPRAGEAFDDLGSRWELMDSGITVKLYPSCAGTHPALDAILDLRREHHLHADDVARVDVEVDAVTPTVLIYATPSDGLEGKFSMPFCLAAALMGGRVDVSTFEDRRTQDPATRALMSRVSMRVSPSLDASKPALTQARVTITLSDGRTLTRAADGARGYPERPVSDAELEQKFLGCAERVISPDAARQALAVLRDFESLTDLHSLVQMLSGER